MAQVFISYFKPERNLTQALADDVTSAGFSVWWDTHLLPGDRFREVIDDEIETCTRAIIIWTPQSIQRDWVVAEAEHAHRLGKLINTFSGGLDPVRIPKPFGQINAVPLEDRQKIIAALLRAAQPSLKSSPGQSLPTPAEAYPISEAFKIVETAMRLETEAQRQDWEQDLRDYTIHLITAAKEVLQAKAKTRQMLQLLTNVNPAIAIDPRITRELQLQSTHRH